MFLARREEGKRIWVYQVCLPFLPRPDARAWQFEPRLGCCLRRTGLSGDGWCALGESPGEARRNLVEAELLA